MKFIYLTLNDLLLGLRDLKKERLPKVTGVSAAKLYGPRLTGRLTEIEALPGAGDGTKVFADEIAEKDVEHDGYGGAIWYLIEACVRSPSVAPELKARLQEVRATFIPELAELKAQHADEAANAVKRAPQLVEMQKGLRAVHVPGGATLYDWVASFLAAGKDLDELLRKRANYQSPDRSAAGTLRGATLGLLNRFRSAIEDELEDDADALAKTDHTLFAYFDELEKRRVPASTPADAPVPPTPPAPPTPA